MKIACAIVSQSVNSACQSVTWNLLHCLPVTIATLYAERADMLKRDRSEDIGCARGDGMSEGCVWCSVSSVVNSSTNPTVYCVSVRRLLLCVSAVYCTCAAAVLRRAIAS